MAFDENIGVSKLANVLQKRMQQQGEKPLVLDFGEIQENGSLLTNTFPIPIPKGEYSACLVNGSGQTLKEGDRVLVAWVQNEAVVIDRIIGT